MTSWLYTHRRSVLFFLVATSLLGGVAAWRLPVGLFPVIDFPRVAISLDAGDRPVDRMVAEVTRPLEESLRAVPNVRGLRSSSSRGAAEVSVNFDWGSNMATAELQVQAAVNRVLSELPVGTRFMVRRMDPTIFPVLGLSLTSGSRDLVALHDLATYRLRPILAALPGVAQVEVLGGRTAELQVQVDPQRLAESGLSMDDVAKALSANNLMSAAGRVEDRYRLLLTLTDGQIRSMDELKAQVLRAGPGGVVNLGSVARVSMGVAPEWTRVTADGRDAVLLNIRQSRGANAVALVDSVRVALAAHAAEIPSDVRVGTFYDQSSLVRAAVGSVRDAIIVGAMLAGIVVLLFLRDLRLTLLVAAVLPAVLATTSLVLQFLGMSYNIMTLGGIAAAVGLVIDDTVVMVEHLLRRLQERGGEAEQALFAAAREMWRPLIGSTLATVVIFAPLALLSGVTGGFFKALALTMSAALVVSLLVALLAVPLLTFGLLTNRAEPQSAESPLWLQRLMETYRRLMVRALGRPAMSLAVAAAFVMLGALAYWQSPSGFMPKMDEGGFILDYRAASGTSLSETDRLLRLVEQRIRALPEVDTYSRRTGLQLGGGLTEANEGDFFIHLRPGRRRDIEAVMSDLRGQIDAQVPGLAVETIQLMEDLIGDLTAVPQPVEIKLFGADAGALRREAGRVAQRIAALPGLVEVKDGIIIAGDAVIVRLDPVRTAIEGLNGEQVVIQLQSLVGGARSGVVLQGEKLIGIRLQSPSFLRDRVEAIRELQLRAPDGHMLALRRIAEVGVVAGQAQQVREDLSQMMAVTARLEGRDLGSAMQDVRRAVRALQLPTSIRVEYGGLYREQQASFRGLIGVFLTAVLLVAALLLYLFESWAVLAAILATIAVSISAVFIGLWVTGTELDVSALMGLTMIVGIVAEIAIFFFSELPAGGAPSVELLAKAGSSRLRPILMTSVIAILALSPLALQLGNGSSMQAPLAVAIISGLFAATPLALVFMPVIYFMVSRRTSAV